MKTNANELPTVGKPATAIQRAEPSTFKWRMLTTSQILIVAIVKLSICRQLVGIGREDQSAGLAEGPVFRPVKRGNGSLVKP